MPPARDISQTAQAFVDALLALDASALSDVAVRGVTWDIPGVGRISGLHRGVDAAIFIATAMRRNGISVTVERLLTGNGGVTALVREVGDSIGRVLDVRVAMTMDVRLGRVSCVRSFVSDLPAYSGYWA